MKKANVERAIPVLRELDVAQSQGASISEACRKIEVIEHSYYHWKREYGRLKVAQAKRLKELEAENARLKKLVAEAGRRCADGAARCSWPHAYGRDGYRRITALLRREGWWVNHTRVERIWRQQGMKVPAKQPKRGRIWLNDGSCVRLRSTHKDHVWSYDFIHDRTRDGRPVRMLTMLDEYTRECLAIRRERRLNSSDVLEVLDDLFVRRGVPKHIRSDNGSEFTAEAVRLWLSLLNIRPLYIEPGSPWENGYIESVHDKVRDELLNRELLDTLYEARVLVAPWRREYNTVRPHSSLGYRAPAPEPIAWPRGARAFAALHAGNQLGRLAP